MLCTSASSSSYARAIAACASPSAIEEPVRAHDLELGGHRRLDAAVLDRPGELLERLERAQRIYLGLDRRDVHEADAVGEPQRHVAQPRRPLTRELREHRLDEPHVLVGLVGLDLIANHHAPHGVSLPPWTCPGIPAGTATIMSACGVFSSTTNSGEVGAPSEPRSRDVKFG